MAHDILIVDDEADIRLLTSGILRDEGYEPRVAEDSASALAAIRARQPSLLILDIWLQGSEMDGLEVLDAVKREHPALPVVMISGHGSIETAVAAIKKGAYDFIEKPFEADRLMLVVDRTIEAARLRRENQELRVRAGGEAELIGSSPAVAQLRAAIDRVAPTGSRVLLTGSPGVGKEVVARMLHARSRRANGSFVVLNAATMAPERMEIELFGIETGAQGPGSPRKIGTYEQAHAGTLFLDQVADMPLETQGKIVRALQDQTFHRVGGGPAVEVDVRVIAASNRDLAAEIAAGHFREDLYYRLNVVPIAVPALTERREDIPELARHFMARSAEAAGLPAREIAPDARAALQSYDWPGNVRQLRNVIDWLLIMASGDSRSPIRADMLPPELTQRAPAVFRQERGGQTMSLPLREAREMFERQYLAAQLNRFSGNISRTAAFVGMERSALHRKLKALGVAHEGRGGGGPAEGRSMHTPSGESAAG
ncbi:MAG: sigma-54-dependent transcriptional regulator [Alphaproteobacteria bacterium]